VTAAIRGNGPAGSALVEALVALVLIALAAAMVASAATAGLRATRRAATLSRTTALAARELAILANDAAGAANADSTLVVASFADPVRRTTEAHRDGAVAALAVHLEAGRPPERVTLATRVLVPQ
jgi:hypothetical protein